MFAGASEFPLSTYLGKGAFGSKKGITIIYDIKSKLLPNWFFQQVGEIPNVILKLGMIVEKSAGIVQSHCLTGTLWYTRLQEAMSYLRNK